MLYSSRTIAEILRSTLQRLDEDPELDRNDPKLIEIRDSILQSISELEFRHPYAA
jgi:hypothetical protein